MMNYHYAHKKIEDISNTDLCALFDEIAKHRKIIKEGLVIHFLQQAFHPLSSNIRLKFDKKIFTIEYYLPMKIKKLRESEIYKLCIDLARISGKMAIEDIDGYALYAFFNKTITDSKKPKRQTARKSWTEKRWM
jgi:hypothetical protein